MRVSGWCFRYFEAAAMVLAICQHASAEDPCAYDKDALLALDEQSFDQDMKGNGGGWRAIAHIPGCFAAAADLLAAYKAKHPDASPTVSWHEGQMRAMAGQYDRAIPLLESDRHPAPDQAGWNFYVDATVAFLRHDKAALLAARDKLAAVPYPAGPGMPPLKDGYIELSVAGQITRMRWPLNLDMTEPLIACFDKPYSEASNRNCTAQ
jgi:hypothetical protein